MPQKQGTAVRNSGSTLHGDRCRRVTITTPLRKNFTHAHQTLPYSHRLKVTLAVGTVAAVAGTPEKRQIPRQGRYSVATFRRRSASTSQSGFLVWSPLSQFSWAIVYIREKYTLLREISLIRIILANIPRRHPFLVKQEQEP